MMQAEIAVLRFGLGAKPGELAAAAEQPRAWLMSQIRGPAPLAVNTALAPSDQIFAGLLAARDERQTMKQESAAQGADAKVFNAIRTAYQPHYRAQVLARAQSAARFPATLAGDRDLHHRLRRRPLSSQRAVNTPPG